MNAEAQVGLGWTGRIMQLLQAVWTVVLVNLLFAAGVLAGLVVLGAMPAGVAAASVLLRDDHPDGVVRTFVREYRGAFRRANLTGIPFLVASVALIADAAVLSRLTGPVAAALTALATVVALATVLTWAVAVTLLVRYRDTPVALLRYALVLPLSAPLTAVGVLVTVAAVAVIGAIFPVIVPLAGVSLPLAVAVRLIDRRLARNDPAHPLNRP